MSSLSLTLPNSAFSATARVTAVELVTLVDPGRGGFSGRLARAFTNALTTMTEVRVSGGPIDLRRADRERRRRLFIVGDHPDFRPVVEEYDRVGGSLLVLGAGIPAVAEAMYGRHGPAEVAAQEWQRPVATAEGRAWRTAPHRSPTLFLGSRRPSEHLLVTCRAAESIARMRTGAVVDRIPWWHLDAPILAAESTFATDSHTVFIPTAVRLRNGIQCIHALDQLRFWQLPIRMAMVGPIGHEEHRLMGLLGLSDRVRSVPDESTGWAKASGAVVVREPLDADRSEEAIEAYRRGPFAIADETMMDLMDDPPHWDVVPNRLSPFLIAERIANAYSAGRLKRHGPPVDRTPVSAAKAVLAVLRHGPP